MRKLRTLAAIAAALTLIVMTMFAQSAAAQTGPTAQPPAPTAVPPTPGSAATAVPPQVASPATPPVTFNVTSASATLPSNLLVGDYNVAVASLGASSEVSVTVAVSAGTLYMANASGGFDAVDAGDSATFKWDSSNVTATGLTALGIRSNGAVYSMVFSALTPASSDTNYVIVYQASANAAPVSSAYPGPSVVAPDPGAPLPAGSGTSGASSLARLANFGTTTVGQAVITQQDEPRGFNMINMFGFLLVVALIYWALAVHFGWPPFRRVAGNDETTHE